VEILAAGRFNGERIGAYAVMFFSPTKFGAPGRN
jgi:hypothetical protein